MISALADSLNSMAGTLGVVKLIKERRVIRHPICASKIANPHHFRILVHQVGHFQARAGQLQLAGNLVFLDEPGAIPVQDHCFPQVLRAAVVPAQVKHWS